LEVDLGKIPYQDDMKTRLQDFGFALERVRHHLDGPLDDRIKGSFQMHVDQFNRRCAALEGRLDQFEQDGDRDWAAFRAEIEAELARLWQDFDENLENLL
jgi:hypothetical protein